MLLLFSIIKHVLPQLLKCSVQITNKTLKQSDSSIKIFISDSLLRGTLGSSIYYTIIELLVSIGRFNAPFTYAQPKVNTMCYTSSNTILYTTNHIQLICLGYMGMHCLKSFIHNSLAVTQLHLHLYMPSDRMNLGMYDTGSCDEQTSVNEKQQF